MWKHRNLSFEERENFVKLYREVEDKYALFRFMKQSQMTMSIWLLYIVLFETIFLNLSSLYNFFLFCSGVVALQIVFVISHMEAHSLFLEYENHYPKNERCMKYPVYYYAFYHHHHSYQDNWAPFLSYYNEKGSRAIVAAHWHGYTMLSPERILFALFLIYLNPSSRLYFCGYEMAVLILPYAHGWQHFHYKRLGCFLNLVLTLLEKVGLVASKDDHTRHHKHDHPTVYQDFSSSGIYMKSIDNWINKVWNTTFYKAICMNKRPYDIIHSYTYPLYIFILGIVPALI